MQHQLQCGKNCAHVTVLILALVGIASLLSHFKKHNITPRCFPDHHTIIFPHFSNKFASTPEFSYTLTVTLLESRNNLPFHPSLQNLTRNGWRKREIHWWEGRTQRDSSTQAEIALCQSRSTGQYHMHLTAYLLLLSTGCAFSASRLKPDQKCCLESTGHYESDCARNAVKPRYMDVKGAPQLIAQSALGFNEACRSASPSAQYIHILETITDSPCLLTSSHVVVSSVS